MGQIQPTACFYFFIIFLFLFFNGCGLSVVSIIFKWLGAKRLFHDTWKLWNSYILVKSDGHTATPCPFVYLLPIYDCFHTTRQSGVAAIETMWIVKPKIFTICLFRERVCQHLPFRRPMWLKSYDWGTGQRKKPER